MTIETLITTLTIENPNSWLSFLGVSSKKAGIFWEFFPKWGGGTVGQFRPSGSQIKFCYRTPDFVNGPFVALDDIFDLAPSDRFLNFSFPSYGVSPSGLRPENLHFFTLHPYYPIFWGQTDSTQWDLKSPISWGNSGYLWFSGLRAGFCPFLTIPIWEGKISLMF